jgi:uncharacterized protein CbrC (UPF0167 family)
LSFEDTICGGRCVFLFRVGREEMEFLRDEIAELKQKIQQDERDYRHATDPAEAERLKEIIDGDKATLRGYVQQMAQIASQSAPSKF